MGSRATARVGEHDVVEVEQLGLLVGEDGGVGGAAQRGRGLCLEAVQGRSG
jgi:hypothetical protein